MSICKRPNLYESSSNLFQMVEVREIRVGLSKGSALSENLY